MSVRLRKWITREGQTKEAWVVEFKDAAGKRRLKTFRTQKEADRFAGVTKAVGSGAIPEPLTRGYRPSEFTCPLAGNGEWKKAAGREAIKAAARAAHPSLRPTTDAVIVHVIAEMPPAVAVADVDNLLKPVLDAMKGIAWMDDTQVCELVARRFPSRQRRITVKIWHMPGPVMLTHLNALSDAGLVH
jgi:hypothetical protein